MSELKYAALVVVGAANVVPGVELVLGIPMAILLSGCAGAMFGMAYTPPEKWGKLLAAVNGPTWKRVLVMLVRAFGMLFTLTGIVFVAGWVTIAAPFMPFLNWLQPIPPAAVCGILSFAGQFWLPRLINAGNRWIDSRGKAT